MTVRTPVKYDGDGNITEMSSADLVEWYTYIAYLYAKSPTVTVTVVSGSGTLSPSGMTDTRLKAGAASTNASAFVAEGSTAEPSTVTVTYDRVNQTYASVSPTSDTGTTWPVYFDSSSKSIIAMPIADIKDTFLHPAIDKLITASESDTTAGSFTVTTSATAATGYTNISTNAIFTDTRADTSAYAASGIPETLDQPTTVTSYFLQRANFGRTFPTQALLLTDSSGNINQVDITDDTSAFNAILKNDIRFYAAEDDGGHKLSYNINGSGNARGTAMVDTRLNGSGNYQQLLSGDDYRSQEFPNGSAATITTYNLRITKA